MNSAEVSGATLPGKDNAQIVFIPNFLLAALSTPPGLEAKSIIKHSFFNYCRRFSSKIIDGIVLITIS